LIYEIVRHTFISTSRSAAVPELWTLGGIMRIIFSIVAVLGLLLTGFSVFEIRIVGDYRAQVRDVQFVLSEESKKEVADAHRRGAVFTGQTFGDVLSPKLDGIDALERGWFVVASVGIVVFVAGVFGVIGSRPHFQKLPPNNSLQATAAAPASCD
jgi:hypothetical protein